MDRQVKIKQKQIADFMKKKVWKLTYEQMIDKLGNLEDNNEYIFDNKGKPMRLD